MKKITKAVIPVAGFGTRFLPFTKSVPKMMLPILDKPVLQIIVEEAVQSGIKEVLFIVGQHSGIIRDYFSDDPSLLATLEEKGKTDFIRMVKNVTELAEYSFVTQIEG